VQFAVRFVSQGIKCAALDKHPKKKHKFWEGEMGRDDLTAGNDNILKKTTQTSTSRGGLLNRPAASHVFNVPARNGGRLRNYKRIEDWKFSRGGLED